MTLAYDAILFDFDGVLAESLEIKEAAFRDLYAEYGEDFVERVLAYHREHGGISRVEKIDLFQRGWLGFDMSDTDLLDLTTTYSESVESAVVECDWVAGARETLEAWHGKVPMYVISGTPEDELQRICTGRGMDHYFEGVRGSPLHKEPIVEQIIARHGLNRRRTLFVGDSMTDWRAADTTGLRFLGRLSSDVDPFPAGTTTVSDLHPLAHQATA